MDSILYEIKGLCLGMHKDDFGGCARKSKSQNASCDIMDSITDEKMNGASNILI